MVIFLSVLVTVIIVFLLFILLSFICFRKVFLREKDIKKAEEKFYKSLYEKKCGKIAERIAENKKIFENEEYKPVMILGRGDVHLTGKLYLSPDISSKKSVILCHGCKSLGETDFGAAFRLYRELNYNILMIDQRAHGKSDGKYTSMGIMESFDIVLWCCWLEMCFGTEGKIVVHGMSMGAFSAIAAAANPEMPQNVEGIVADSFYPLIRSYIFNKTERNLSFLAKPAVFFMNMFYRNHIGFDMRDFSLYSVAKAVKIPVLFIHSENDPYVPVSEVEAVAKRISAGSEIVAVKKAPRGTCFVREEKQCFDAVKKFIGEI